MPSYPGWVEMTEFWLVSNRELGLGQGKLGSIMGDVGSYQIHTAIITDTSQKPKHVVVVIQGEEDNGEWRRVKEYVIEVPEQASISEEERQDRYDKEFEFEDEMLVEWMDERSEDEDEEPEADFRFGTIYEYDPSNPTSDTAIEGDPQNSEDRQLKLDEWHWNWWAYNITRVPFYPQTYPIAVLPEENDPEDEGVIEEFTVEIQDVSEFGVASWSNLYLGTSNLNPENPNDRRQFAELPRFGTFEFRVDNLPGPEDWQGLAEHEDSPPGLFFEVRGGEGEEEEEGGEEEEEWFGGPINSLSTVLSSWVEAFGMFVPVRHESETPINLQGVINVATYFDRDWELTMESVPCIVPPLLLNYDNEDIDPDTPEAPSVYNVPSFAAVVVRPRRDPPD